MIKLTEASGDDGKFKTAIWVPLDVLIRDHIDGMALIKVKNIPGNIIVQESPKEVAKKILECKLAMVKYSTGYAQALQHHGDPQWIFENAELKISDLAGLEEPQ
ncbi:hypothetical protein ACFOQM_23625 [Paenibacillus sp. GCM10012307]|uniref:Uncharacterized protein n=1 Tax=Paenibacillus roseus TaxID=2798579 RepID=A0A934J6J9_9BACL|nr:hypothetical protein [Paenibacillus roseus]MBJ6364214.1 hypothetical protein [Paenibacillus roseus]